MITYKKMRTAGKHACAHSFMYMVAMYTYTFSSCSMGRGYQVDSGGDLIRPALHTALTTSKSISLFRACFTSHTTYNIKTVPSGDITTASRLGQCTTFFFFFGTAILVFFCLPSCFLRASSLSLYISGPLAPRCSFTF